MLLRWRKGTAVSKKKKWDEFVKFVRGPGGPRIRKFMKETLEEDMDNFLFLANSEEPDGPIIRGMHFPDSDLLEPVGCTVFETSEKNVYIAAYRKSSLLEILQTIHEMLPEKLHEPVWEKAMDNLLAAAEEKIAAGDIRKMF